MSELSLREKIAEYIYNQEMDSRYQNFFSWEQAKSENDLKSVVNDYYNQADTILTLIRTELMEGMPKEKENPITYQPHLKHGKLVKKYRQGFNDCLAEVRKIINESLN